MKQTIILIMLIVFNAGNAFAAYDKALALYQENKYQESLAMVANDLVVADDYKENSPNYNLRFLAAHNHWKMGNDQSAVAHFRKCMSIRKTAIEPYIDCSILLLEKQKFNDAASVAEDGLKLKDDAMLFWVLGRVAIARKDFWRAKELFEKANSIDPELYVSYNDLGIVLINLNKAGDANTAFSVALAIFPDSAEANYNMAYSCILLGKKNDAVTYANRALELAPNNEAVKKMIQKIKNNQ